MSKERIANEYEKVLKNNLEEVERLQKIIDGLLTLSQFESNKIPFQKEKIDLNELLIEAVSKINNLAKKKNVKVILKLYEVKGESSKKIFVFGDSSKLLNVFLNLLDNAIKYSDLNSKVICYENFNSAENKIIVSIKDNGIGIPSENLENIFERFYRADLSRTRNETNGVGLGLAIAKAVIESHEGKISVSSEFGKGATFTVTLPAQHLPD